MAWSDWQAKSVPNHSNRNTYENHLGFFFEIYFSLRIIKRESFVVKKVHSTKTSVWAFLEVTVRLLEMKTCMTCRLQTLNVYTLTTPVHRLAYGIIIIVLWRARHIALLLSVTNLEVTRSERLKNITIKGDNDITIILLHYVVKKYDDRKQFPNQTTRRWLSGKHKKIYR